MGKGKTGVIFIIAIIALTIFAWAAYAAPDGASLTVGLATTGNATSPGNFTTEGGNITQVNLSVDSITSVWQGFYGTVSGALTLDDSSGNTLYNFSFVDANGGEVYASRNSAVAFASIAVNNFCTVDELLTGTGTDRVNNTFTNNTNPSFLVGSINITANTACATNTLNSTGQSPFPEVILNDTTSTIPVYASIIKNDHTGFNGKTVDYQMLVPENQTAANTLYFFYAELS